MRIRERRLMLGITQAQLAKMIGVTFQQAQKYECGITRVSAGRLFEIARELESPIAYFFEGFGTVRQPLPQESMLLDIAYLVGEIKSKKLLRAIRRLTRVLAVRD